MTSKPVGRDSFPYLEDIPEGEYHRAAREGEWIGSHQLGDFRACPLLYHRKMTGEIERVETSAFLFGRALHKLVLEGQAAFNEEFVVSPGPVNPKTGEPFGRLTKAYREWAAAQTADVVAPEDFEAMRRIAEAVHGHAEASRLLSRGFPEGTVRVNSHGLALQARLDWFNPFLEGAQAVVDLKTCENLDAFEHDARRFGYPNQLAFYRHVLRCGKAGCGSPDADARVELYLVGVEKREPFRVGVWKLTEDLASQAEAENFRAMDRLCDCRERDVWPTGYEDLRVLDLK